MSLLDRILGIPQPAPPLAASQGEEVFPDSPQRITEQIDPTLFSGSNDTPGTEEDYYGRYGSGSEEDYYWRRLSDVPYLKDVLPATYLEIHHITYEAYKSNPLAFAIVELTTSFTLGRGIKVAAKQNSVQRTIMKFWNDTDNHMEERVYQLSTELSLYGELFIRFFVNKYDGSVKIRMIDPSLIDEIQTDPEDIETPLRFHRRPVTQTVSTVDPPMQLSQLELETTDTAGDWFKAGEEMVQFTINKVSNAKRGSSDLATLLPWLRRYKDWLTDRVRINKYKGAFLWDVTLRGADKKTIDRKKMEYGYPPEPGSVLIHNESETWQAAQPNINANEAYQDGRAIKLMVAVGATLPEHFLSDGTSSTRATAAEMGLPTLLKFQRRQRVMKNMLRVILDRVILEAQKAGKLGKSVDTTYDLIFPEIDSGNNQVIGTGLAQLTNAMSVAKAQGWISNDTAMKLLFKFAEEETDIEEEKERIAAQTSLLYGMPGMPTNGARIPAMPTQTAAHPLTQNGALPSDTYQASNGNGRHN